MEYDNHEQWREHLSQAGSDACLKVHRKIERYNIEARRKGRYIAKNFVCIFVKDNICVEQHFAETCPRWSH